MRISFNDDENFGLRPHPREDFHSETKQIMNAVRKKKKKIERGWCAQSVPEKARIVQSCVRVFIRRNLIKDIWYKMIRRYNIWNNWKHEFENHNIYYFEKMQKEIFYFIFQIWDNSILALLYLE